MDKIWDPFVTSKPIGKGTGLGLSISSGIVNAHKGRLKAFNKETGGACIEIILPHDRNL
jgi:C4-dicarboxylate-specific signal transduction histidine kinase